MVAVGLPGAGDPVVNLPRVPIAWRGRLSGDLNQGDSLGADTCRVGSARGYF